MFLLLSLLFHPSMSCFRYQNLFLFSIELIPRADNILRPSNVFPLNLLNCQLSLFVVLLWKFIWPYGAYQGKMGVLLLWIWFHSWDFIVAANQTSYYSWGVPKGPPPCCEAEYFSPLDSTIFLVFATKASKPKDGTKRRGVTAMKMVIIISFLARALNLYISLGEGFFWATHPKPIWAESNIYATEKWKQG